MRQPQYIIPTKNDNLVKKNLTKISDLYKTRKKLKRLMVLL